MKLLYFRFGIATNSSSSHSLLLLPQKNHKIVDELPTYNDYGWETFTLASEDAKMSYLASMLAIALPEETSDSILEQLFDEVPEIRDIDHQSAPHLIREIGSIQNLQAVVDFFKRPQVVILGGNDNGDTHPLIEEGKTFSPDFLFEGQSKRKVDGDVITVYDSFSGTKLRLSKNDDLSDSWKPSTPELIDVKITNKCTFGCEYCYQSSVPSGEHARYKRLLKFSEVAKALNVFEVAIGGGEPTLHPNLEPFISSMKKYEINTAVTTRNIQYVDKTKTWAGRPKRIGISIDSVDDIKTILSKTKQSRIPYEITLQYIVGAHPISRLHDIIDELHDHRCSLLLLGFKETGFAQSKKVREDEGEFLEALAIRDVGGIAMSGRILIDSLLCKRHEAELKKYSVKGWSFSTLEGFDSMYVDLVTGKIGPSSFCPQSEMIQLDWDNFTVEDLAQKITQAFSTW